MPHVCSRSDQLIHNWVTADLVLPRDPLRPLTSNGSVSREPRQRHRPVRPPSGRRAWAVLGLVVTLLLLSLQQVGAYAEGTAATKQAAKHGGKHGTKHGGRHASARGGARHPDLPPADRAARHLPRGPVRQGLARRHLHPGRPGPQGDAGAPDRRGWQAVDTSTEDAWGSAAFSPGAGTYRARTTTGGRTWVTGSVDPARLGPAVRGHLLRHDARHLGLERPEARARERLRPAHLRPRRPGRAPRR